MSAIPQPRILAPITTLGRSLTWRLAPGGDPAAALGRLAAVFDPDWGVVGIGDPLVRALGRAIDGLAAFTVPADALVAVPSTQGALWFCLLAEDRSDLFDRSEAIAAALAGGFVLDDALDTFRYREGRDLTGYEDGTANPEGEEAVATAIVDGGPGLAGSSFVAVQRWVHDLAGFRAHSAEARDHVIGRAIATNEEIEEAPESAHVKRTAQELFDPTAFMVRRSMPWTSTEACGLEFVSYCRTLDAFDRMMRRMAGGEDGIVDALFSFSRPVTGGAYWCPPVVRDRLDLAALGL